jgi:hypothetical protein
LLDYPWTMSTSVCENLAMFAAYVSLQGDAMRLLAFEIAFGAPRPLPSSRSVFCKRPPCEKGEISFLLLPTKVRISSVRKHARYRRFGSNGLRHADTNANVQTAGACHMNKQTMRCFSLRLPPATSVIKENIHCSIVNSSNR